MPEPRSSTGAPSQKSARSRKGPEKPDGNAQRPQSSQASSQAADGAGRQSADSSPQAESPDRAEDGVTGRVISLTTLDRNGMVSLAAYYRSERRNFEPGQELEDWLAAEAEINALLLGSQDGEGNSF